MAGREELDWILTDILERRRAFEKSHPGVRWSIQAERLRRDQNAIDAWAEHVAALRVHLTNPEAAPQKALLDITIEAEDFDGELFDALAEWMAPVKLKPFGFGPFTILVPGVRLRKGIKTPDYAALFAGDDAAVEVKNLRAHECAESVMFRLFSDLKRKGQDFSGIRLVIRRSFRGTLNSDQQQQLAEIVTNIRTYPLGAVQQVTLSKGVVVVFEVIKGNGDVMGMDHINLDDICHDVGAYSGLLNKIKLNSERALQQLASAPVGSSQMRVVAMRWDIPFVSIPFPASLRTAVLETFRDLTKAIGVESKLLVFTNHSYVLATTL